MNKNIKQLIENIVKFNPVEYEDDEVINNNEINNALYKYHPENKQELRDIIFKKIIENKLGNSNVIYPDLTDIDI